MNIGNRQKPVRLAEKTAAGALLHIHVEDHADVVGVVAGRGAEVPVGGGADAGGEWNPGEVAEHYAEVGAGAGHEGAPGDGAGEVGAVGVEGAFEVAQVGHRAEGTPVEGQEREGVIERDAALEG